MEACMGGHTARITCFASASHAASDLPAHDQAPCRHLSALIQHYHQHFTRRQTSLQRCGHRRRLRTHLITSLSPNTCLHACVCTYVRTSMCTSRQYMHIHDCMSLHECRHALAEPPAARHFEPVEAFGACLPKACLAAALQSALDRPFFGQTYWHGRMHAWTDRWIRAWVDECINGWIDD